MKDILLILNINIGAASLIAVLTIRGQKSGGTSRTHEGNIMNLSLKCQLWCIWMVISHECNSRELYMMFYWLLGLCLGMCCENMN